MQLVPSLWGGRLRPLQTQVQVGASLLPVITHGALDVQRNLSAPPALILKWETEAKSSPEGTPENSDQIRAGKRECVYWMCLFSENKFAFLVT